MNEEQETLLVIRGAISGMSPEIRDAFAAILQEFAEIKKQRGEEAFTLAIAYVGAELAAI